MLSLTSMRSHFERLPDEILLLVCQYLSSADVLFSFYGLNCRLSQTINDYCRHVNFAQIPFKRFNHICTSILPEIGPNIQSLTVSNEWTGVLSKIFIGQFGKQMSVLFPHLKRLILVAFINQSLTLFIECLQNLTELSEITINGLFAEFKDVNDAEILLHQILLANNNRLNSIIFSNYSIAFSVNTQNNNIIFSNIKKLHIDLRTLNDLHRLLSVLPHLHYLHTTIHNDTVEKCQDMIVPTLKHFHLESFCHSWTFNELASILKRIPNVEELSIEIDSYADHRLTDGKQMTSLLQTFPLKKFDYFLRLEDSSSVDYTSILSTWQEFDQKFICLKNDNEDNLILYSLPFRFHDLILKCSLAKNKVFSGNYAPQVKFLHLYNISKNIGEIFSTISKYPRLHRLCLQINENILSESQQGNTFCQFPSLTALTIARKSPVDIEDFRKLLERSPNLYNLNMNDDFLHSLLTNELVCKIFEHNITHLCITISSTMAFELFNSSIPQLVSVFSSLKYLYIWIENDCQPSESLIITILNHLSKWNYLISFVTVGIIIKPEILTKGIRQWVMENSTLSDNNLFIVDYFEERFRLWL